jgi:hypothetical protein
VRVPVTILRGSIASATDEAVMNAFVKRHRDSRVVRVEGASHFLPMEHPDAVRAEILRAADVRENEAPPLREGRNLRAREANFGEGPFCEQSRPLPNEFAPLIRSPPSRG